MVAASGTESRVHSTLPTDVVVLVGAVFEDAGSSAVRGRVDVTVRTSLFADGPCNRLRRPVATAADLVSPRSCRAAPANHTLVSHHNLQNTKVKGRGSLHLLAGILTQKKCHDQLQEFELLLTRTFETGLVPRAGKEGQETHLGR